MKLLKELQEKHRKNKEICNILNIIGKKDKPMKKDLTVEISDIFEYIIKTKLLTYNNFVPLKNYIIENGSAEELFHFIYITHSIPEKDMTNLIAKLCEKNNLYILNRVLNFSLKTENGLFNEYGNILWLSETQKNMLHHAIEKLEADFQK